MHADKRVVAFGLSNKFEAERDYVLSGLFTKKSRRVLSVFR